MNGSSDSLGLAVAAAPRASASPSDARAAARALHAFGFDLLRVSVGRDTNGVLSPASIALALAMARAGALGETARQMDEAMRDLAADEHPAWLNALDQALTARNGTFRDTAGKEADIRLRIANAPFAQRGLPFQAIYLEVLAARFAAGLRLADFRADPEAARRGINGWVDGETEHRIAELLAPGVIDRMTRLVLVNAIYLKAAWQTAFLADNTHDKAFTRLDGREVMVPTMHGTRTVPHATGNGWRAIDLPYVGGSLAMTIVVPDDLGTFVEGLDADVFDAITGAMGPAMLDLALPRFGIETQVELGGVLAGLGMRDAFDPKLADFGGITTAEPLSISAVVHQANIDVDEQGTEAAAATAIVFRLAGMPVPNPPFRVDRPFLFALRDVETGAVVFLGQVTEPRVRA